MLFFIICLVVRPIAIFRVLGSSIEADRPVATGRGREQGLLWRKKTGKKRACRHARSERLLDQQVIDALETTGQFVTTSAALAFVVVEVAWA